MEKSSVLYNITYGCGALIGPILGGLICDKHGFRATMDGMAIVLVILTVFNALMCLDIHCRKTKQPTKKREFPELEKKPLLSHFIIGD